MDDARLARAGRNIAFLARTIEPALGDLSLTAYRVLVLVSFGDARSSEIAARLVIGRPTVTYAVDALADKGLITRQSVDDDRRVARLEITEAGRHALAETESRIAERLRPIFDKVDDARGVLNALDAFQAAQASVWADRRRSRSRP